jgi:hypothetical protein
MTLSELIFNFSKTQTRKLSGGITCRGLSIREVSMPGKAKELIVTGDVNITVKVLELTTSGAPKLHIVMKYTENNIAGKLKGETMDYGLVLSDYDTKANKFNKTKPAIYNVRYKMNYLVRLEQIRTLSQLSNNDFVLAIVDRIGLRSDKYTAGGLTAHGDVPATVTYNGWCKYPNIATHEFFHTLGLPDLSGKSNSNKLMFEVASKTNNLVSNSELADMNAYLMKDIVSISEGNYSNQSFNTVNKLRNFLNNPTNGFKYNKAKFR